MDNQTKVFSPVTLRAPEPEDLDLLYIWENDSSVWHTSLSLGPLSRHQISEYIDTYDADLYARKSLRFMVGTDEGRTIGTVDVYDFEPRARHAFVGIYIAPSMRRQGLGSHVLEEIKSMMSERYGLSSLAALVAVDNQVSRSLFEKSGFVESGCLKGWISVGKRNVDACLYQFTFKP